MSPAATPARFVEHRSERLHLLVRGADHPPLALGAHPAARQVQAGLYVTVLARGGLRLHCGDCVSEPRALGMQVLAVREPLPWSAQASACAIRVVGVSMLRPDLRARQLEGWFDSLFARHEPLRQVQVAADARSLQLAGDILDSDPRQPLQLLRLEAAAQAIFVQGIAALTGTRAPSRRERLLRLAAALQADLARAWTLADMAAEAGMSARALSESFGREFGASPFVWLRQQRLLQGRHLVLDEGLPVALAAERLGFSSAAHFCTAFRAQFGETPGRLRQRLAQQAGQGGA